MKRIILSIFIILIIVLFSISMFPKKEKSNLKEIRVAEVAHSIFYAPMYASSALGYFEEEGLDVEFILANGADKVTAAVLSNDVEIGFCGSESTIYVYNEGEKDYLVNFAGLTKKDGSFIVGRNKDEINNFDIKNLKGKFLIAGREGGMPAMTLEWLLNQNDIEKKDLNFDTSIAFSAMSGAFVGGIGDYVALFEPTASQLEKEGYGYIVASLGELGGTVPYTTFNARKSFIDKNPDVIENFTKAINKGLEYVHNNTSEDIAKTILDFFPDTSLNTLTEIVERYKNVDSWFKNTYINEEDFKLVQDIMINANFLDEYVEYEKLVDNTHNKK